MKLDDLARQARHDLSAATGELPLVPIERVRRRRLAALTVPAIGTAVAVLAIFFGIASLDGEPDGPVITTPETTTAPTTTSTTVPSEPVRFAYEFEDLLPAGGETWPAQIVAAAGLGDDPNAIGSVGDDGVPGFTVLADGRVLVLDPADDRVAELNAAAETFFTAPDGLGSPRAITSSGALAFVAFSADAGGPTTVVAITSTGVVTGDASTPQGGDRLRVVGGDVWLGSPGGSWTTIVTADGTPIPESSRRTSPAMPVADGSTILVAGDTITRVYGDGAIVEWTIPAGWEITGLAGFLDESVAVTVGLADGPLFQTVAAFQLGRDGSVTPLTALGVIHTANRPPAQSSLFADDSVYLLETGIDRMALYRVAPPEPPATAIRLDPAAGGVIVGTYPDSLVVQGGKYRLPEPAPLQTALAIYGMESVAWVDGTDGLVYLDSLGQVHLIDAAGDAVIFDAPSTDQFGLPQLIDVMEVEGRPLVAIMADARLRWFDLDGTEAPGPVPSPITHDEFGRILSLSAGGRTVTLVQPDYRVDEDGQPTGAFAPASLEIVDGDRTVAIEVGTEAEPWTTLQAFDGRRVVVTREPLEPASADRTVLVIDLECSSCLQILSTGPSSVDLIGAERSTGPVVAQGPLG